MLYFGLYELRVQYLGKIYPEMTEFIEIIIFWRLILDSSKFKNCSEM